MFVVWKRPDGYHDATPGDFRVAEAGTTARIWLHKTDRQWYPFRISGGWQESDATQRLNGLVNLLGEPEKVWTEFLTKAFNNSMTDDPRAFVTEQRAWLEDLKNHLKGDTWEIEIMGQVIGEVSGRLAVAGNKIQGAGK
ncbi:MAG: hypothetical protein RIQ81_2266 [Pseudomonadota bacterium]